MTVDTTFSQNFPFPDAIDKSDFEMEGASIGPKVLVH